MHTMSPHPVLHHQIDQLKSDNLHSHLGAKRLHLLHLQQRPAITRKSELSRAVELSLDPLARFQLVQF